MTRRTTFGFDTNSSVQWIGKYVFFRMQFLFLFFYCRNIYITFVFLVKLPLRSTSQQLQTQTFLHWTCSDSSRGQSGRLTSLRHEMPDDDKHNCTGERKTTQPFFCSALAQTRQAFPPSFNGDDVQQMLKYCFDLCGPQLTHYTLIKLNFFNLNLELTFWKLPPVFSGCSKGRMVVISQPVGLACSPKCLCIFLISRKHKKVYF